MSPIPTEQVMTFFVTGSGMFGIQLTLEQHGLELRGSTYTCYFFQMTQAVQSRSVGQRQRHG